MQLVDWSPLLHVPDAVPKPDEFTWRDLRAAHAWRAVNGKPEAKPYAWRDRDAARDAEVAARVAAARAEALEAGTGGRGTGERAMTGAAKVTALTTAQLHLLDRFCMPIRAAFGRPPYLVGSAGHGSDGTYRDVDVRLILPDDEFAAACPTRERWELLSLSLSVYLSTATGLPVDFQVQRQSEANEKHDKPRNPLGTGRVFAGGGDATPDWGGPR